MYQFQPSLPNGCQQAAPPETVDMAFAPTGATPANAVLTAIGGTNLIVSGSFPGSIILVDQNTVEAFDPDQFQLRMPDGRTLLVSRTFNLQSVADTNNNTLTFSANGIMSSTGKGVSFQRDAQNRITSITDPAGNVLSYTYTAAGDLDSFTDQSTWIKEGNLAVKMTRLSCHRFRSNEVRLGLSLLAYNLGNLWRGWPCPSESRTGR